MSDDAEENQEFVIEECSKLWSNASGTKLFRSTGPAQEKRTKGKSGNTHAVRKDLDSQEEKLLTEAGLDGQEMDKMEREQILVALRASLGNSGAAMHADKEERQPNEIAVEDLERDEKQSSSVTHDKELPPEIHLRRINREKASRRKREERERTDLASDTEVENLGKQQPKKRKCRRKVIESEEEGEDGSSSELGKRNLSSNVSSSMVDFSSVRLTEEQRQSSSKRLLSLISRVKSQQLTPIKEKSQCEEAPAGFSLGNLCLSVKDKSLEKDDKKMKFKKTWSADQACLVHERDGIQNATKMVADTKADGVTLPCVLELKAPDTDEEQPNPDMPCLTDSQEVSNPHKAEDASEKEIPLSSLNQEEKERDDRKPLRCDDFFSWCKTTPSKLLKRKYRRKQLREKNVYFCPSPYMNPGDYTKVILELFDVYFTQFTSFQRKFFKNILSWEGSITAGRHRSGMVNSTKRGGPALTLDFESDEEHNVSSLSASLSYKRKKAQVEKNALNWKREAGERDGVCKPLQTITSQYFTQTLETQDTQPYDSNDELPDIGFPLTQQLAEASDPGRKSENGNREEMEMQTGEVQDNSSSQGSGSLIVEDSGDSLQLQGPSDSKSKTAVVWKQDQDSSRKQEGRDQKNLQSPDHKLTSRKRKVELSPVDEDVLGISDDECEISFLQKKNVGPGKVHTEACSCGPTTSTHYKGAVKNSGKQLYVPQSHSPSKHVGLFAYDSSQPYIGTKVESRKGQSVGSLEDGNNKEYVPETTIRGPTPRRLRSQLTGKGQKVNEAAFTEAEDTASIAEQTDMQADMEVHEELAEVQCPMCFKSFPSVVVEHHAYSCQGSEPVDYEGVDERPLRRVPPQRSVKSELSLRPLTRRPLHISDSSKVTQTCTICSTQVTGEVAFQQHYGICSKRTRFQQHDAKAINSSRQESNASRDSPGALMETSNDASANSEFDTQMDDTIKDPDFIP